MTLKNYLLDQAHKPRSYARIKTSLQASKLRNNQNKRASLEATPESKLCRVQHLVNVPAVHQSILCIAESSEVMIVPAAEQRNAASSELRSLLISPSLFFFY